jgi:hypothetical protein
MKAISTSDITDAVCVCVCHACIYAFHTLPQRSERRIYKNYINVFIFLIKHFIHTTVFVSLQSTWWGPKITSRRGTGWS